MVDALVSGGPRGAQLRTMCYMVGGNKELVEQCRPMFETSAKTIFHVGPLDDAVRCETILWRANSLIGWEYREIARLLVQIGQSAFRVSSPPSHFIPFDPTLSHQIKIEQVDPWSRCRSRSYEETPPVAPARNDLTSSRPHRIIPPDQTICRVQHRWMRTVVGAGFKSGCSMRGPQESYSPDPTSSRPIPRHLARSNHLTSAYLPIFDALSRTTKTASIGG